MNRLAHAQRLRVESPWTALHLESLPRAGHRHPVAAAAVHTSTRPPRSLRQVAVASGPARSLPASPAPAPPAVSPAQQDSASKEAQVLDALRNVIDPDFGEDIVACGFVKDLVVRPTAADSGSGSSSTCSVSLTLELTTPACPVKETFQRQSVQYIKALGWVSDVQIKFTSQPAKPSTPDSGRPGGLSAVRHIIAVSSCKGGVGKSTVAVNLAYTLAQMGAKVGIFDADVYGPSLPTMVSPASPVLEMDPATKAIHPADYEGVKLVSFGFAGQGSAIMRGAMVSGLVTQMLTTAMWGDLDYLVVDFPPGTGDIQLTLCQTVSFSAAVIVTTPQKLAFIDVAKGIRMFARLMVPCTAVVENMSYFTGDDGKQYHPFGRGSGERIQADFGLPHLVYLPIVPDLSQAGDGGVPLVVSDPTCSTSQAFMELGAAVVTEVAKMSTARNNSSSARWDAARRAIVVQRPGVADLLLPAAVVRRNDTSASSVNEWTGLRETKMQVIADDIQPQGISPLGNYAVQITWQDGVNQVASFELLGSLEEFSMDPVQAALAAATRGEGGAQPAGRAAVMA